MNKEFFNWMRKLQNVDVLELKEKEDELFRLTVIALCKLIKQAPPGAMDKFIATEHWLDDFRQLSAIDSDNITYIEDENEDEDFKISIEYTDQSILKGIIDSFILFMQNENSKYYEVHDDATNKTLLIKGDDLESAILISDTLDYNIFHNGSYVDVS